jgi:ketosteroid isomerase-like protein
VSQENVEIARMAFDAVEPTFAGAAPGLFQWLDPEVEWLTLAAIIEGTHYHGHDGVRDWIEDVKRDWPLWEIKTDEFLDVDDDRVLVFGSWHAQGHHGGAALDIQGAAWLLEFSEGRIRRLETFTERSKAREAVGLP